MRERIMNIHTLAQRTFHTLAFEGSWKELMGEPERNFTTIIYGGSTSSKSTFALQFADMLALKYGKVFYNSHEEGLNATLRDRAAFVGIRSKRLFVGDRIGFDSMVERIRKNHYRFVFIDSVQFMGFTYAQFKELVSMYPKKSFIIVSQGSSEKQSGAEDIRFATDIKMWFKGDGSVHCSSRFKQVKTKAQLYLPYGHTMPRDLFGTGTIKLFKP